jgi:23S rRNA (pseudouridine1915-N3)-methyltransferase
LAFIIGGADGIDPSLRAKADFALSFGPMVWPHMLVRVMLAEQLYRATSILAGGPYHRV